MAKRSVRKERRTGSGGGPVPPPASRAESPPVWRTRAFWIGGAAIGLVVAALAVGISLAASGGDEPDRSAAAVATPEATTEAESPEALEEQFEQRDRDQIEQMTAQARDIAAALGPTMTEFDRALRDRSAP